MLQGHYQNAYVTHDIDAAIALMRDRYGLEGFNVFDPELTLETPSGPRVQKVKAGCAWAGGMQIELIEPVHGFIEPFLDVLPADKSDVVPRFHHISLRRDDLDGMMREARECGLEYICSGGIPDLQFVYLDGRASLGHIVEFVWASEAGWNMVGWPEGRPA